MNIKVTMKSGKTFELDEVSGSIVQITKELSRGKFIRFGPVILNTTEIEYVQENN